MPHLLLRGLHFQDIFQVLSEAASFSPPKTPVPKEVPGLATGPKGAFFVGVA